MLLLRLLLNEPSLSRRVGGYFQEGLPGRAKSQWVSYKDSFTSYRESLAEPGTLEEKEYKGHSVTVRNINY